MASGYSSTAAGGALTSEEVAALLIEPLLTKAVTLRTGPRISDTRGVPLLIPTSASLDLDDPWRSETRSLMK